MRTVAHVVLDEWERDPEGHIEIHRKDKDGEDECLATMTMREALEIFVVKGLDPGLYREGHDEA